MKAPPLPAITASILPIILVVDDDADMRELYHRFLSNHGFLPLLAEGGSQAIQLYQEHLPDLVLMDASMPGLDGFETTLALRNLYPVPPTPIIMVTGLADEESVDAAFRCGAEEYIAKPINWAVLRHRIGAILQHHRVVRTLRESEERFRSLAQSSSDAIISADARGCIIFWNKGAERCFGYTAADAQDRPLTDLMPKCFHADHQQGLADVEKTGRMRLAGKTKELTGLHKDGREFPLEIALSTWLTGAERFFSAIIRDISARKQMERERELAMHTRIAISALLETALEPLTMNQQLSVALNILHTLPRWASGAKSGIYLNDDTNKVLNLAVWKGWQGDPPQPCPLVPHGDCLCGRAAINQEIIFSGCVSQRPSGFSKGMPSHGLYCIPILFQQRLLGVLNVYLPQGHAYNVDEEGTLHTIAQTLAAIIERRHMEEVLARTHAVLRETRLEIIHRLGMAAEFRDNETGLHIVRMSHYAAVLGRAANMDEAHVTLLLNAAPMHDVGKIGIADGILLKPGRLTADEFEIMKTHAAIGAHMLFGHDEEPLKTAHIIALTHHERWDGKGYPHGLAGELIPLEGRICAISDVFDALTSERPYKRAWEVAEATAELQRGAGSQFDPWLVKLFLENMPQILKIKEQFQDHPNLPATTPRNRGLHGFAAFIQWDASLETGYSVVDQEHRHLVSLINKLHHALASCSADEPIPQLLGDLQDYAVVHFANEEALMRQLADPWLIDHMAEHQLFTDRLVSFQQKYRFGSKQGVNALMVPLRKWLVDHLLNMDKRSFIQKDRQHDYNLKK